MVNWIRPRKPNYTAGRVVIISDDMRFTEYKYWYPLISKEVYLYNQFRARKCPLNLSVNPGFLGLKESPSGTKVMNAEQLQELANNGVEMLSHGSHHVYLNYVNVSQPLSPNDTRIYYDFYSSAFYPGLEYLIVEGEKQETFTITNVSDYASTGYIDISPPLTNSYTTNAKLSPTADTITSELQGTIDALNNLGIECKYHVNAIYRNNDIAQPILEDLFEAVVTLATEAPPFTTIENIDLYDIRRTKDISNYTTADIDNYLTDVKQKDTIMFVQGHGGTGSTLDNLRYLVHKAYEMGVRIISFNEAIEYIKEVQQ